MSQYETVFFSQMFFFLIACPKKTPQSDQLHIKPILPVVYFDCYFSSQKAIVKSSKKN